MWRRRVVNLHSQILQRPSPKHPWISSILHFSDSPSKKAKAAPLQERAMRDRVTLWVKGGEGGHGCHSFRRTRTDRYGKPDGGNGGRGGNVILQCSSDVWDFSNLQHHLNAKRGGNGISKNRIGSRGSDKVAQVPVGTVIHLVSGETPSFVVDTSVQSLQPWDIPDTDQADTSKSLLHNDSSVSSLSDEKATDGSSLQQPKDFSEKSALSRHKVSENPNSTKEREVKANFKGPLPRSRSYGGSIQAVEYATDESEMESDEETEEDEESNEEYEGEFEEEYEEEEEEVQYSVAEFTKPGQRLLVARGGEGGLGNIHLSKERKNIKPYKLDKHNDASGDLEFEDGEDNSSLAAGKPGSESVLILELKSIADVGLVGMPNAGKSTLLGAISRAKPTVGHYAFTTLRPSIGNLNYEDFFSVTVADIPGLIKGAHENRGLGHAFLRHIERTKVLAYVVDLAAALDGRKGIPPWEQLRDLVSELEHHQQGLSHRPSLIVANKIDEEGAETALEELKRRVQGVPIFPICAVLEEGVPELKVGLRKLMDGSEAQCLDLDRIILD